MKYRLFGKTGIKVSEIGHGTWAMGNMWGPSDDKLSVKALIRALELGVNFIDTASVYGNGRSEKLIATALEEYQKEDVFIATKVPPKNMRWPASHDIPVEKTFPIEHILKSTERSLKNLKRDHVDLQQLHVWSDQWLTQTDWPEMIQKLKQSGKIRFFGISINDHEPENGLKLVESGLIDSVQVIYNLFDQSPEKNLFPLCLEKKVAVIARVPLDEGSLTGKLTPETEFHPSDWRKKYFAGDRLRETCERVEKLNFLIRGEIETMSQAALKFCLSHPAVSTVIPGMRTLEHVEENCKVSDEKLLSSEELKEVKLHAWPRNFYSFS